MSWVVRTPAVWYKRSDIMDIQYRMHGLLPEIGFHPSWFMLLLIAILEPRKTYEDPQGP